MTGSPDAETVRAWHAALNAGDVDSLLALSDENVEVSGPRGSGHGAHLLREWVARAGIRLQPGRMYHREGAPLVVEERARWRLEDGQLSDAQSVACVFGVRDGQVVSVARYPDAAAALAAAGLDASD